MSYDYIEFEPFTPGAKIDAEPFTPKARIDASPAVVDDSFERMSFVPFTYDLDSKSQTSAFAQPPLAPAKWLGVFSARRSKDGEIERTFVGEVAAGAVRGAVGAIGGAAGMAAATKGFLFGEQAKPGFFLKLQQASNLALLDPAIAETEQLKTFAPQWFAAKVPELATMMLVDTVAAGGLGKIYRVARGLPQAKAAVQSVIKAKTAAGASRKEIAKAVGKVTRPENYIAGGLMGMQDAGSQYATRLQELMDRGYSRDEASRKAGGAALAYLPPSILLESLSRLGMDKPAGLFRRMISGGVREQVTEVPQLWTQQVIDWLSTMAPEDRERIGQGTFETMAITAFYGGVHQGLWGSRPLPNFQPGATIRTPTADGTILQKITSVPAPELQAGMVRLFQATIGANDFTTLPMYADKHASYTNYVDIPEALLPQLKALEVEEAGKFASRFEVPEAFMAQVKPFKAVWRLNIPGPVGDALLPEIQELMLKAGVAMEEAGGAAPELNALVAQGLIYQSLMAVQAKNAGMALQEFLKLHPMDVKAFIAEMDTSVQDSSVGNALNQFVGISAVGADLNSLADAKRRLSNNEDREDIFRSTGWFQIIPGQWSFIVDPRDLTPVTPTHAEPYKLPDILSAPKLYAAYPEFKDVNVKFSGDTASFIEATNTIQLPQLFDEDIETLVHEMQHKIQSIEHHVGGGNPDSLVRTIDAQAILGVTTPSQRYDLKNVGTKATKLYYRLGGEIEAYVAGAYTSLVLEDLSSSPSPYDILNDYVSEQLGRYYARRSAEEILYDPSVRSKLPLNGLVYLTDPVQHADKLALRLTNNHGGRAVEDYVYVNLDDPTDTRLQAVFRLPSLDFADYKSIPGTGKFVSSSGVIYVRSTSVTIIGKGAAFGLVFPARSGSGAEMAAELALALAKKPNSLLVAAVDATTPTRVTELLLAAGIDGVTYTAGTDKVYHVLDSPPAPTAPYKQPFYQIKAQHGGRVWAKDEVDSEQFGTGTGMAQGWGFYVSEAPDEGDTAYADERGLGPVPKSYAEIAKETAADDAMRTTQILKYLPPDVAPLFRQIMYDMPNRAPRSRSERLELALQTPEIRDALTAIGRPDLLSFGTEPQAAVYDLTVHKGKTPGQYDYMDWDGPLTEEQKKKVKDLVPEAVYNYTTTERVSDNVTTVWAGPKTDVKHGHAAVVRRQDGKFNVVFNYTGASMRVFSSEADAIAYTRDEIRGAKTGRDVYYRLNTILGSPKAASLWLLEQGIDGNRYLANQGKNVKPTGEPYYNYVVFDPRAVTVEGKTFLQAPQAKPATAEEIAATVDAGAFEDVDGSIYMGDAHSGMWDYLPMPVRENLLQGLGTVGRVKDGKYKALTLPSSSTPNSAEVFDPNVPMSTKPPTTRLASVYKRNSDLLAEADRLAQASVSNYSQLFQGRITMKEAGGALIEMSKTADASTFLHEMAHYLYSMLPQEMQAKLIAHEPNAIKRAEWFARAFELYMRDGLAPDPRFQSTFDTMAKHMQALYPTVKGSPLEVELSAPMQEALAALWTLQSPWFKYEQVEQDVSGRAPTRDVFPYLRKVFPVSYVLRELKELADASWKITEARFKGLNRGKMHTRMINETMRKVPEEKLVLAKRLSQAIEEGDTVAIAGISKSHPEVATAVRELRQWYAEMLESYKAHMRMIYATQLKPELSEIIAFGLDTNTDFDQIMSIPGAAKRFPAPEGFTEKKYKETVNEAIERYQKIDTWGLEDYFTHVERGNYRVLDSSGHVVLVAATPTEARERLKERAMKDLALGLDTTYSIDLRHIQTLHSKQAERVIAALEREAEKLSKGLKLSVPGAKGVTLLKPNVDALKIRRDRLEGEPHIFASARGYAAALERKMALDPVALELAQLLPAYKDMTEAVLALSNQFNDAVMHVAWEDKVADYMLEHLRVIVPEKLKHLTEHSHAATWVLGGVRGLEATLKLGYRAAAVMLNTADNRIVGLSKAPLRGLQAYQWIFTDEGRKYLREEADYLPISHATDVRGDIEQTTKLWHPLGMFHRMEMADQRYLLATNYLWARANAEQLGLRSEESIREYARRQMYMQVGIYDRVGVGEAFRGPAGKTVFQFKQWMLQRALLVTQMDGWEVSRYLVGLWAVGGLKMFFYTLGSLATMLHLPPFLDELEKDIAERSPSLYSGLLAKYFGIDMSQAFAWRLPTEAKEWMGPALSDIVLAYNKLVMPAFVDEVRELDRAQFTEGVSPLARNIVAFTHALVDDEGRVRGPDGVERFYAPRWQDKLKIALGLQSTDRAIVSKARSWIYEDTKARARMKARAMDLLQRGFVNNVLDEEALQLLLEAGGTADDVLDANINTVVDPVMRTLMRTGLRNKPDVLRIKQIVDAYTAKNGRPVLSDEMPEEVPELLFH